MIKRMRELAPLIMWVVIVAFVSTIFFAWGMDFTRKNREAQHIGKIGKAKIPLQSFVRQVEVERERYRMNTENGELTPQQSRMLPRQVWEAEVSRKLHKKVFEEMSLGASADEVFEHIKRNPPPGVLQEPYFQTDSVFDTSKYIQFLNTPESFDNPYMLQMELYARDMIIPMEKLRKLIEVGKVPTKVEIEQEYRDEYDRAVYEYVKVQPSSFLVDSSEITDELIENYYHANPDTFTEEEQAELYFVKIPKVPTAEDEQSYLTELMEIKKSIIDGESTFEEEARNLSDDEGSARNDGDLGWFSKGQMVPEFEEMAFSLDTGVISDPVKSGFGYHLILVEEREEQDSVVRVKARHILRKIQPTTETLDSLEKLVETLREVMLQKGFSEALADKKSFSVDSTGLFKKGDMIWGMGYLYGATSFAFSDDREQEEISERIENNEAFYLLEVKRRTEEGILPLADVRERIFRMLKDSIQTGKARSYLEKIRSTIDIETGVASLQDTDTLLISSVTDTVSRKQYVPDVGYDNPAMAVAFLLPVGTVSKVIESEGAFFIVKPLWKDIVESIPWEGSAVVRIRSDLIEQSLRNAYMEWYVNYKKSMAIEENLDKYYE